SFFLLTSSFCWSYSWARSSEQLRNNTNQAMSERIHKATLSQPQGREGWSVIFRHPVLLDRATGKPGRRVRRGLGTKEKKAAARRHLCGSSSVRILPANDSPRPQRRGRLSPIWRLFSVLDHSAPPLLFFREMKCATISRSPCPRPRWPPIRATPISRSCGGY